MDQSNSREQWGTRLGFILAAVGSAVGLGNVWRFPFQVGEEGGIWFVLFYLVIILAIGLPAMLVEFTIGRRSQRNPVNAFEKLGYPRWRLIGVLAVFTGLVILSYYSVVGGWTVRYTLESFTGAYFGDPAEHFGAVAFGWQALGFHALFMAIVVGIVAFGIKRGIELCTKVLVPAIILLLIGMVVYALQLEGAAAGLSEWLAPDLEVIQEDWTSILPSAAGQAFFTLSLGMGAMITYSSYIADDDNLVVDSGFIVAFNTGIALLAGLVIFPVLFAFGISPEDPGPGALFIGFGEAIAEAPGSTLLGAFFFGTVAIAAISSAISILEVVVSFVIDQFGVARIPAALGAGLLIFIVGVPTAFEDPVLTLYDEITGSLLLPIGMGLLVVFVGWFYREAQEELARGLGESVAGWLPTLWKWHVRTVILVVIAVVVAISLPAGIEQIADVVTELSADAAD